MKEKDKELTYTVTEEEYQEGLTKGWTDDDMLRPGTYRVGRSRFRAKPGETNLINCRIKVSLYIDGDIMEYFRKRAEQPNAAPYQTQINSELRKVMENGSGDAKSVENDILNDKKFLKALKKKLEAL